jgi:hypothetical protein
MVMIVDKKKRRPQGTMRIAGHAPNGTAVALIQKDGSREGARSVHTPGIATDGSLDTRATTAITMPTPKGYTADTREGAVGDVTHSSKLADGESSIALPEGARIVQPQTAQQTADRKWGMIDKFNSAPAPQPFAQPSAAAQDFRQRGMISTERMRSGADQQDNRIAGGRDFHRGMLRDQVAGNVAVAGIQAQGAVDTAEAGRGNMIKTFVVKNPGEDAGETIRTVDGNGNLIAPQAVDGRTGAPLPKDPYADDPLVANFDQQIASWEARIAGGERDTGLFNMNVGGAARNLQALKDKRAARAAELQDSEKGAKQYREPPANLPQGLRDRIVEYQNTQGREMTEEEVQRALKAWNATGG